MQNPFGKKVVIKLFDQKQNYYQSGIENIKLSNEMSGRLQTAIATIILAELAFLGTVGFDNDLKMYIAIAATLLVLALLIFIISVGWQQKGVLKAAKYYINKANKIDDYIKEVKKDKVDELPEHLRIDESVLLYNKCPNRLMFTSYILAILGTIAVLIVIWGLVI